MEEWKALNPPKQMEVDIPFSSVNTLQITPPVRLLSKPLARYFKHIETTLATTAILIVST